MNQDCVHDALNFIDDSMIQSVDVLRNRPYRLQKSFLRVGSLVATLCVLLAGVTLLNPKFEVMNDSSSINYGSVDDSGILNDKVITEQSAESVLAGNSIRVRILKFTEDGFIAEYAAKNEILEDGASDPLMIVLKTELRDRLISELNVGDEVDVSYDSNKKADGKIYAFSIQKVKNEQ